MTEENILFKSKANKMEKFASVGGTLQLTNKALVHKPHKLNLQSDETYILLEEIKRLETKDDFLILRNLLTIITKDDDLFKFRVNKRKEWVSHLNEWIG